MFRVRHVAEAVRVVSEILGNYRARDTPRVLRVLAYFILLCFGATFGIIDKLEVSVRASSRVHRGPLVLRVFLICDFGSFSFVLKDSQHTVLLLCEILLNHVNYVLLVVVKLLVLHFHLVVFPLKFIQLLAQNLLSQLLLKLKHGSFKNVQNPIGTVQLINELITPLKKSRVYHVIEVSRYVADPMLQSLNLLVFNVQELTEVPFQYRVDLTT